MNPLVEIKVISKLAFLSFDSFPEGFYGYVKKVSSLKRLQTIPRLLGKTNETPRRWNEHLGKTEGYAP